MESEIRSNSKYELLKPTVSNFEERKPVLALASVPYMSTLRIKKLGTCLCDPGKHYHWSFLEFNASGLAEFRNTHKSQVEVCFNNTNLFDRKLPLVLGVKSYWDIRTFGELNNVLYRATYWYRDLWDGKKARRTVRWIGSLVTGLPIETDLGIMLISETTNQGMNAFKNIINSCDGVLTTLFLLWEGMGDLGRPSWGFVNRTQLYVLHGFLRDYSIPLDSDEPTFYEKVKDMKNYILGNVSKGVRISVEESPFPELFIFHSAILFFQRKLVYRHQIVKLRIISDTRCVGLPPPVMREKAYEGFWKEATTPSKVPSKEEILLTKIGLRRTLERVEEKENLRGLFERAYRNEKVSLSGSADLESSVEDGGKILSANLYIKEAIEKKIPLINLETGKKLSTPSMDDLKTGKVTPAQLLLSYAVQEYSKGIDSLMRGEEPEAPLFDVRAVAVSDQSKYRIVTAGHFLYNVLLQPVAQVFKALFKVLESTSAGMEKQFHMWEFFKRIPREMLQYVRTPRNPQEVENFFYCEDWKKATDKMNKFIARIVLMDLMEWVGIPKFYRDVVDKVYTLPKRVLIPVMYRDIPQEFFQVSGVFQGDPVTKNLLQISHIVSREAGRFILRSLAEKSHYQRGLQISAKKKYDAFEEKNVYTFTNGGVPFSLSMFKKHGKEETLKRLLLKERTDEPRKGLVSEILHHTTRYG